MNIELPQVITRPRRESLTVDELLASLPLPARRAFARWLARYADDADFLPGLIDAVETASGGDVRSRYQHSLRAKAHREGKEVDDGQSDL